jgi:CMP-N,N'-diacetyllegionaminic acid synthase
MSQDKMYVVSLIPARSGSKGVINKNLRLLKDKSLLEWSIRASIKTEMISRTVVSTNSPEYAEQAKIAGADVPFLRPDSISQDNSTDLEFVNHAIDFFEEEGRIPDLIVHLRPTTPFRDPEVMTKAIKSVTESKMEFSAIRSVHEMSESAYKSFEIHETGNLISTFSKKRDLDMSNQPRQNFPLTYSPNGYIDLLAPGIIKQSGMLHGSNVFPFITEQTIEIDNENDLKLAESLISINQVLFNKLFGGEYV